MPAPNLRKEIVALKTDYDVILIDGGGRITATARAACRVADFIVIPTRPSKPDILSTVDFLATVVDDIRAERSVDGGILINQLKDGTVIGREAVAEIRRLGCPTFDTALHSLVGYEEAMAAGMSIVEYAVRSKASKELQALYRELKEAV